MTVSRWNISDVTRQLRKFENSGSTARRPNSNKVTRYMLGRLQLTAIADANGIVMRNSDDRRDRRSKVVGGVVPLQFWSQKSATAAQTEPRVNCAASRKHTGKFMPLLEDISDNAMTKNAETARDEYLRLRGCDLAIIQSACASGFDFSLRYEMLHF